MCARRRGSWEALARSPGSSPLGLPDAAALPGSGIGGRQGLGGAPERTRASGRMCGIHGLGCLPPALVENGRGPTC